MKFYTLRLPKRLLSLVPIASLALAMMLWLTPSCSGSGTGTGTTPAGNSGVSSGLQCAKQDLTQLVGPKGWTLLATVYDDLTKGDYGQLIADLITTVGKDAVGCAVVAIDSLDATSDSGSGSGSGNSIAPRAIAPRTARAKELITKYDWHLAPAAAPAQK